MARRTRKIDNLIWDHSSGSFLAQSAGSAAAIFATVGTTPVTLLRIRGQLAAYIDAASAPTKLVKCTFGLIKVPEGSGATLQYDPVDDANAPWIYWSSWFLGYEEMVTDVISVQGMSSFRETIDNKAMRRIRPDEELQVAFSNVTVGTASSVNMTYTVRWLQGF